MITRRTFLVGAATALTFPVIDKFKWFIDNRGIPLLEGPEKPTEILYVNLADNCHLELGDITENGPCITWREFLEQRGWNKPTKFSEFRTIYECWGVKPSELNDICEHEEYDSYWYRNESPTASAVQLLSGLDIGPKFRDASGEFLGGLKFIDRPSMCSDYIGVHAECKLSLSLLQQRLNELNTGLALQLFNA